MVNHFVGWATPIGLIHFHTVVVPAKAAGTERGECTGILSPHTKYVLLFKQNVYQSASASVIIPEIRFTDDVGAALLPLRGLPKISLKTAAI